MSGKLCDKCIMGLNEMPKGVGASYAICENCSIISAAEYLNGLNKINGEWISVKDRLPPKDFPFLNWDGNVIDIMIWDEKRWYCYASGCNCCNGYCSTEIVYWMPLPKPPENNAC